MFCAVTGQSSWQHGVWVSSPWWVLGASLVQPWPACAGVLWGRALLGVLYGGQGPPEPLAVEEEAAAARLPTLLEDSLPSR